MRYKYVAQTDSNDCGIAALSMIMKNYKTNVPLAQLRKIAHTDLNGTTISGIVTAAEQFNFNTKTINANENFLDDNTFENPFIAHVLKNDNLTHYYVIYKVTKNELIIADPDSNVGIKKIKKDEFYSEWTKVAILISPNDVYQPINLQTNPLKTLIPLIRNKKKLGLVTIFSALIILIIQIATTFYLQRVVDTFIPNKMNNTIAIISIGLIVIYIYQQFFNFVQITTMNRLSQSLTSDIVLSYIDHVLKLPMDFFSTRRTGEIISRFTDTNSIVDAISSVILSIFIDTSMIIIVSFFLLRQNMRLFFLVLIALPIYLIIIISFFKPFKKKSTDAMQANSIMSSSIIEDLNGIETIKSLGVENEKFQKIKSEFNDYLTKQFDYIQSKSFQVILKTITTLILNVAVLWFGSYLIIEKRITLGQVITFSLLISYFITPLENIINLQPKLQSAKAAYNRLNEVYLVTPEILIEEVGYDNDLDGDIQIHNLSYSYSLSDETISNISFCIKKNSVTCLVGPSGSGKTTLGKLLVKFYDNQKGEILLNGNNINDVSVSKLRHHISYLPQEPYIFTGSILDNLIAGLNRRLGEDEIWEVLDIVEIKEEIIKMPLGLQTSLSAENISISGGQKQRIALARSLLMNSSVLILDEVTSQLDLLLERKIISNLLTIPNKTIIFIAHRLEVALKSDNIVVLSKGEIVEQGNYDELVMRMGFFYSLIHEENKISREDYKMGTNQQYYNNKVQAAIPIVQNILNTLNGPNRKTLKKLLTDVEGQLRSTNLDRLILNNLCLNISLCLVNNGIILSKTETASFKELFKIIQISI